MIAALSLLGLTPLLSSEFNYPAYPKNAIVISGEFESILSCKVIQSKEGKTLTMHYTLNVLLSDYKGDLADPANRNWYTYQCMQPMIETALNSLPALKQKWGDDHPNLLAYDSIIKHLEAGGILGFRVYGKNGGLIANVQTTLIDYKSLIVEGVPTSSRNE